MKGDKFKVFNSSYRVNKFFARWVFGLMFLFLLPQLLWFVGSVVQGNGLISLECSSSVSSDGFCVNPFFDSSVVGSWESLEFLPVGFVVNPLPWFYDLYQLPVLFLFLFGVLFNHFKYNKHKEWFK